MIGPVYVPFFLCPCNVVQHGMRSGKVMLSTSMPLSQHSLQQLARLHHIWCVCWPSEALLGF